MTTEKEKNAKDVDQKRASRAKLLGILDGFKTAADGSTTNVEIAVVQKLHFLREQSAVYICNPVTEKVLFKPVQV